MKKMLFVIICCLFSFQVIYSQTITTAANLNKKLVHDFYSVEPTASVVYYVKYQVKNGALIGLDDSGVKDSVLRKNIQNFFKKNGASVSWKSILNTDADTKIVDVIHPIFILSDLGKRTNYGSDLSFDNVYQNFFDKIFGMSPAVMLPPILMKYSTPADGK